MRICEVTYDLGSLEHNIKDIGDSKPDWQVEESIKKTGVEKFNYSHSNNPVDLAIKAYRKLSDESIEGIDLVIYVTQTYNKVFPGAGSEFAGRAGIDGSVLMIDYNIGCSGFPAALFIAEGLLNSGSATKALIITSDVYSHHLNFEDRATTLLFSDGATATVLVQGDDWIATSHCFGTVFEPESSLTLTYNETGKLGTIRMDGYSVFQFAKKAFKIMKGSCFRSEYEFAEVDMFFIHQGSKLILDEIERINQISPSKLPRLFPSIGNVTSSSIPTLLALNIRRLEACSTVFLAGFGVGLSYSGLRLARGHK